MILRDLLISCRPKTDDFWCSQSWRIFYSWILWFDILKKSIVNDARQTTYHLCLSFLIRLRLVVKNQSYFEMMFTVIANHQKCLIWIFTPKLIVFFQMLILGKKIQIFENETFWVLFKLCKIFFNCFIYLQIMASGKKELLKKCARIFKDLLFFGRKFVIKLHYMAS